MRELLSHAVTRQLVADVPMCTLLSGGLDSSAVTALAAKALGADGRGPVRSFSVDSTGERFQADAVRGEPDTPFVHAVVEHVAAEHTEVLLDGDDLTDERVRAAVLRATDLPPVYWGDMWPSLYLLFRAVRARSTVALSGEAADELFGGYRWYRNRAAVAAETFPWLTPGSARYFGGASLLDPALVRASTCRAGARRPTGRPSPRYPTCPVSRPTSGGCGGSPTSTSPGFCRRCWTARTG